MPGLRLIDYAFSKYAVFPHPLCSKEGYPLAMGGDLHPDLLLMAYGHGIFPWFNKNPILWWFTSPRFVLIPEELHITKNLSKQLRKTDLVVKYNTDFDLIIQYCADINRKNQDGTWITPKMKHAYQKLFEMGWVKCCGVYADQKLVGGLYGVLIGSVFYGESMFSLISGASKIAFTHTVSALRNANCTLIDCQQETAYLASFGAKMIPAEDFYTHLKDNRLRRQIDFPS